MLLLLLLYGLAACLAKLKRNLSGLAME